MNKLICNSADWAFATEIISTNGGMITLTPTGSWKKIDVIEKLVYSCEIKQQNPGPVKEETVTATTRHNQLSHLIEFINFPIVLRMKTDAGIFYVGSPQYPVMTELSSDMIFDKFTFKSKSIP